MPILVVSGEEFFFKIVNVFSLCFCYLQMEMERGMTFHLNNLESPLPEAALCDCPSLVESCNVVLEQNYKKSSMYFH